MFTVPEILHVNRIIKFVFDIIEGEVKISNAQNPRMRKCLVLEISRL